MKRNYKISIKRPNWLNWLFIADWFVSGLAFMLIWNAIFPSLAGLPLVSYWQSVGIVFLVHLAFPSSNLFSWFKISVEEE